MMSSSLRVAAGLLLMLPVACGSPFVPLAPVAPPVDPPLGVSVLATPRSRPVLLSVGPRSDGGACIVAVHAAGYDNLAQEFRPVETRVVDVAVDGSAGLLPPPPLSRREGGFFEIATTAATPVRGPGCAIVDGDAGEIAVWDGAGWVLLSVAGETLGEVIAIPAAHEAVVTVGSGVRLLSPDGATTLFDNDASATTLGPVDDDGLVVWGRGAGGPVAVALDFAGVERARWTLPVDGLVHASVAGTSRAPFAMVDLTPVQLREDGFIVVGNDLEGDAIGAAGPPQLAGAPVRSLLTTFGGTGTIGVAALDGVARGAPLLPSVPLERPCACDRAADPACACIDTALGLQWALPSPAADSALFIAIRGDLAHLDVMVRRLALPGAASDLIDPELHCGCEASLPFCIPSEDGQRWGCVAAVPPPAEVPPAVPGDAVITVVDVVAPPGRVVTCEARADDGTVHPCTRDGDRLQAPVPTRFDGPVGYDVTVSADGAEPVFLDRFEVMPRGRVSNEEGLSIAVGKVLGGAPDFNAAPVVVGARLLTFVAEGLVLVSVQDTGSGQVVTATIVPDTAGCLFAERVVGVVDRALVACPAGFALVDTAAGQVRFREAGVQNWQRVVARGGRIAVSDGNNDVVVLDVDGVVQRRRSGAGGGFFTLGSDGALLRMEAGDRLTRVDPVTGAATDANSVPVPSRAVPLAVADGRVVLLDSGIVGSDDCSFGCTASVLSADGGTLTALGTVRFAVVGESATTFALISGETVTFVDSDGVQTSSRQIAPVEQVVQAGDVALFGGILVSHLDLVTATITIPRDGTVAFGGTPGPFGDDGISVIVPPAMPASSDLRLVDRTGAVQTFAGGRTGVVFAGVVRPLGVLPLAPESTALHPAFTDGAGTTRSVPCLLFTHRPRATRAERQVHCAAPEDVLP